MMNTNFDLIKNGLRELAHLMQEEDAETIVRIRQSGNVIITQTKKIRFHLDD